MLDCGWWIARLLLVFLSTVLLRPAMAAVRADDASSAPRVLLAQARHRDTTPPVLVLTAPSEGAVVTAPTLAVRGVVTDEGAVTVRVEGRRVPVRAGAFAADVSLRRGPNRIEVEAIDAAGNRTRVSRQVRFEDLRRIQALVPPVLVAAGLPTLGHLTLAPDGVILVTAPQAGRIYRVPGDGSPPGLRADHLRHPLGIAAAGDGSLFVAERGADRILRLTPDGTKAVALDRVDDPRGLALGREGGLFITARRWRATGPPREPEAHRGVVVRRDLATGAVRVVAEGLVAPEGIVAGGEDAEESLWVVAERRHGEPEWRDAALFRITLAGTVTPIPGPHLWRPLALARDALGSVWLTARRQYGTPEDMDDGDDEWERGVLFKVSAGVWQRFATHLDEASGLAFAAQGDLLVAEADRGRILRFRAPPAPEVITPPPTSAPTVTLTGTAEPLALIVARGPAGTGTGPTDAGGRFQISVPLLPDQPNRIEVFAVSAAGTGLASAPTVITTVQESAPPAMVVETPPPNALTNGSPIPVRGRVTGGTPPVQVFVNEAAVPVDVSGGFAAAFPLLEGPNEIRVRVVDAADRASTDMRTVTLDTTPPSVVVTSPAEGAVVTGTTVAVMGTVSDANPSATVSVNGQAVPLAPGGQFGGEILLPVTQLTITVTATDRAGNAASRIRTVVRDATPPALGFVSVPPDLTNSSTLTVTVAATDAVTPADQIQFAFSLDSAPFSPYVTVPTVTYPGATDGVHTIQAKARDQVGNESAPLAVTVRVDTVPPAITLTAPAANFLTNAPQIGVSGSVADTSAIAEVTVNGQAVTLTGTGFSRSLVLGEGANTITVTARDAAGNLTTATVSGILDTLPPVLTFTAPASDAVLNTTPVAVTGTVSEAVTSLTVSGVAATVSGNAFSVSLAPSRGRNTLTASATDPAGNVGVATRSFTFDDVAPVVRILTPTNGQILSQTSLTVTGTVDDSTATVTVNGVPAAVQGGLFTASGVTGSAGAVTLTAQATDAAGNVGTAQITLTVDTTPPTLGALTVPGEVTAGTAVTLAAEASDNLGLATLDLLVDGRLVASGTTSPVSVSFTIPPDKAVNETLTVTARAVDVAGQVTTQLATMRVTGAAVGPGFLRGLVLDDTKGLPLTGATVTVTVDGASPVDPQVTGADGQYAFTVDPGTALVRITKDGTTAAERKVPVRSDLLSAVADARLTPRDTAVTVLRAAGGVAADTANALRLTLPASAVQGDVSLTLTAVSSQGLIARLPLGWTPILAADIAPASLGLAAPGTLSVRVPEAWQALLPAATAVNAARYDPSQGWIVLDAATVTNDGLAIEAALTAAGQVAFLLPDAAPQAPPAPVAGQPLAGVAFAAIPEDATAAGAVAPAAIPPGTTVATGQITVTPTAPLPSGTLVQAVVSEKYTLLTGEEVTPPSFVQELVLYQCEPSNSRTVELSNSSQPACGSSVLTATFAVTPSKQYTLKDLAIGTVHVALQTPETGGQGTIIGPEGGTLTAADGTILTIPPGALARETVVAFASLAESDLRVAVPAGFQVLKAVNIDLTRATLALSAELAFPLPAGITGDTQVLVARVIEVDGVLRLQAVGVGQVSGGLLTSKGTVAGVSFPGITSGGTYVALRATAPVGFVAGTITDAASAAKAGILVSSSIGLVDVSRSDGRYLVAVTAGSTTITATDRATGQGATQAVTVSTGSATIQPVQVQVIPPTVVSVTPAAAARNVPVNGTVTVTFSQTIAKASLSASSLVLSSPTGPVEATLTLSPLGTEATLYPSKALASQTTYSLVVSQAIQDTHGVPLSAPFTSQFMTASAPPPPPAAGAIIVSFPDDQGNVTVTATQGTAAPDNLVIVINTDSGAVASATVGGDGSFQTSLYAVLGDELLVMIRDAAGKQTVVSAGAYVGPDGTTIVTSGGGTVSAQGGGSLTLAPRAVKIPSSIKLSPVLAQNLAAPVPPDYQVLNGLHVEADQAFRSSAKLTLPVPSGLTIDPNARPFLARQQVIAGETLLVMVDSLRVLNGELTTSSPPFEGVLGGGDYFPVLPLVPMPALLTGRVMTTVPDGTTQPVPGVIIRTGENTPVAVSRADGSYALYVYPPAITPQVVTVTATEPATHTSKMATVNMSAWTPGTVQRYTLDFALPGGAILADHTPPTVKLTMSGPAVQGSAVGLGSAVIVTLTATDDRAINPGSATLMLDGQGISLQIGEAKTFTATFTAGTTPNLGTLEAAVADTSGNIGRATRRIQTLDLATRQTSILGWAPEVREVTPTDGAGGVNVFDVITVQFTEPVRNLTTDTIRLEQLTGQRAGSLIPVTITPDIPESAIVVTLTPQINLEFGARYQLTLTTGIHDWDAKEEGTHLAGDFVSTFTVVDLAPAGTVAGGTSVRAAELLDDGRLVVLDRLEGLKVVDVTDPKHPHAVGGVADPTFVAPWTGGFRGFQGVAVVRDFAYADSSGSPLPIAVVVGYYSLPEDGVDGQLAVVSLANPSAPTVIGRALLGRQSTSVPMVVIVAGQYAVVGAVGAGLQVVDLAKAIEVVKSATGPLFDSTKEAGLVVPPGYDFGKVPLPAPVGLVRSQKNPNQAYTAERTRGVFEVGLASLPALTVTRFRSVDGVPFRIALAEDVPRGETTVDLLLVATNTGLSILNLTTPEAQIPSVPLTTTTGIFGMAAQGSRGLAFLTTGTNGLQVIDLKAPIPTVLGTQQNLGFVNGGVVVDDRYAYVAAGSDGVQIVRYDPDPIKLEFFDAQAFGPYGYDGDATRGLQGFQHLPTSTTVLLDESARRVGALTDGASFLVLRVAVPSYGSGTDSIPLKLTFTLSDPDGASGGPNTTAALGSLHDGMGAWPIFPDPNSDVGTITVTITVRTTPKEGGLGAVIYRPPVEFVRGSQDETEFVRRSNITMTFDCSAASGTIVNLCEHAAVKSLIRTTTESKQSWKSLKLVRPPLVLVHGINSSRAEAWTDFQDAMAKEQPGAFHIVPVDYSKMNNSGFEHIYSAVREEIRNTLMDLQQGRVWMPRKSLGWVGRIAAARVDVLAHSMGGLATRFYIGGEATKFRRPENYLYGDLRRIITVGTPFKGSAIAAFVWNGGDSLHALAETLGKGNFNAYRDMTPESAVLRSFENVYRAEPEVLRGPLVHTIAGVATYTTLAEVLAQDTLLKPFRVALPSGVSDGVVCVKSQYGGSRATSTISPVTHTMETSDLKLRLRVQALLNSADALRRDTEGRFDQYDTRGMPPGEGPAAPTDFTCP